MKRIRGKRPADRHQRRWDMYQSNKNLRERASVPYYERNMPLSFREHAIAELLPLLVFTGRKITEQHRVATHCLHNAVLAGIVGKSVGDSRNTNRPGVRLRVRMWDALVAGRLVIMQKGSEASGRQTRYLATSLLLKHFHEWPLEQLINFQLVRNTTSPRQPSRDALVVLRSGNEDSNKALPMPEDELNACFGGVSIAAYLENVEDDIEFINRSNLRHSWEAFKELPDGCYRAFQPNVCFRQLHSKRLMLYARLYTWDTTSAQNLPKLERQMMRIDGESVAELDYAGLHIRMLYHFEGDDPSRTTDIYRPECVLPGACLESETQASARRFVKSATNILLNNSTRKRAILAVGGLLHGNAESLIWASLLRQEGITARDAVDRIVSAHPKVKHRFFTEIGSLLQTLDGMVMRHILMAFAMENRPALGIHDSVLCRASDAGFAEAMMKIHYHALFGFWPAIRQVY